MLAKLALSRAVMLYQLLASLENPMSRTGRGRARDDEQEVLGPIVRDDQPRVVPRAIRIPRPRVRRPTMNAVRKYTWFR